MAFLKQDEHVGNYKIVQSVHSGGMGRIFLAHELERPAFQVALKISLVDKKGGTAYQDLLRTEAEVLYALNHPGIVRLYPLRIDEKVELCARADGINGTPWYYIMEYIDGPKLNTAQIAKDFSLNWRLELFYQIVQAVDYMHKMGYAHGDLKPDNILFRYEPVENRIPIPVLVDFGTASPVDRPNLEIGGSWNYSPPEVLLALQRDDVPKDNLWPEKIDIWALGAIYFELITGRRLVPGKTRNQISTTVLGQKLDAIRDLERDLPKSLDNLLSRLLHKDPAQRPPTFQIIRALDEKLDIARPPRLAYRPV